jgi:ATP-dependent helicase/nuclease subunit A
MAETAKWTPQQKLAIEADGRDVLVTASAGTGKTSVLAGRCLRLLADAKAGIGVRQMLVLTFTNAAAEEMRWRIADSLRKEYESSGSRHLKRQLMLVDAADIGTIHSFCQKLIREHFYRLSIDPAFRLIDEDEQKLLKARMLEETVDWAWQQANLTGPLRQLLSSRNVRTKGHSFLEEVVSISDFLDGVASRQDWCARAIAANNLMDDAAKLLAKQQEELILGKLRMYREQIIFAMSLDEQLANGLWHDQIAELRLSYIDDCIAFAGKGDMAKCVGTIGRYVDDKKKSRFANKPKEMPKEIRERIHEPIGKAIAAFVKLKDLAVLNPTYNELVGPAARQQSMVLIELVKRFDYLYQEEKRKANCLDFADLEHLAAKLFQGDDGPSDIAIRLRSRYKAIFVDEYQDINSIQKQILALLAAGRNVFAVGDIKQSIYAFRGAVPDIFLRDLQEAEQKPDEALRVDLTGNFRSRQEVLNLVNAVFGRIMTVAMAGVDYDEKARLSGQLSYEPLEKTATTVELHLLDRAADKKSDTEEDEENDDSDDGRGEARDKVTKSQLQAAVIAQRIRRMVSEDRFDIYDKETRVYRPVQYQDIVILMRSMGDANDYSEVLSLAGIPVHSQSAAGYFEATEISDSLALLKVLDNPQRDIELAALLRSPMFGVSDSELLKIRLTGGKDIGFYECLCAYVTSGPDTDLKKKLVGILDTLQQWRTLAAREGIANMLWQAYRETGYLSFVAALPKGRQRRANILNLHSRAIQFAGFVTTPGASLGAFVEFVEKLVDEGQDYKPADVMAPGENAVRIMSVHKSKGLEFPVVFLAGMEKGFNLRDIAGDCLFDEKTTLGLGIIDPRKRIRLRSMANEVIAARKLSASLAEEMRIFYVALTRARERLILTAAQKAEKCRKLLRNGLAIRQGPLPEWMLSSCRSSLEWLLYGLSDRKEMHDAFQTGDSATLANTDLLSVHIVAAAEQDSLAEGIAAMKKNHFAGASNGGGNASDKEVADLLTRVTSSLTWKYPSQAATQTCAKTSVTQLTHRGDEFAAIDYSAAFEQIPLTLKSDPDSLAIEPRTLGTATHLVIQSLDITRPVNEKAVRDTIGNLVSTGALGKDAAEAVDAGGIAAFFGMDVGKFVQANSGSVMREWPFTFAMPLAEYDPNAGDAATGEKVIVQGIIDLLVRLPERLVIVDFKTDRVSKNYAPQRAETYRGQIGLYGRAAGTILNCPVVEKWLYFLSCRELVKMGNRD